MDGAYATELLSFVVAGASSDHYALCEVSLKDWPLSEIKTCIIDGFRGVGTQAAGDVGRGASQAGDMLMLQDGDFCGTATGPATWQRSFKDFQGLCTSYIYSSYL